MSTFGIIMLIFVGCMCILGLSFFAVDKLKERRGRKKYEKWVKNNGDAVGKYADAVIELFIEEGKPATPTYMTMEDNIAYINKYHDVYSSIIESEICREIRHCFLYNLLTDENMSFEDTFKTGRILDYGKCAYYLSEAIRYDYNEDKLEMEMTEMKAREEAEKKRIDEKLFALMDEYE